jgi:hypothetical protein
MHEDAFGMMPQRAMTTISDDLLRLVEPVMDALVITNCATAFSDARRDVPWSPPSERVMAG